MQIIEQFDNHTKAGSGTGSGAGFSELNSGLLEPAFLSSDALIKLSKGRSAKKVIDFMAQQIARSPADLQLHLKRIQVCSQEHGAEGLYGALLDLFVVLQEKGLPLRKRLLEKFHGRLNPAHYLALAQCLETPPNKLEHIPPAENSMLSDGRSGVTELLIKQEAESNSETRDPVEDARDLINSGQITKAQTLLEKILLVNPQRQDVSEELMIIYRHSRNHRAVEKVLQCTKNLSLALRNEWESLGSFLKSNAS